MYFDLWQNDHMKSRDYLVCLNISYKIILQFNLCIMLQTLETELSYNVWLRKADQAQTEFLVAKVLSATHILINFH